MSQTQISPISAAQHYATSASFWEQHAKMLQHQLDEANARAVDLETQIQAAQEDARAPVERPDP